MNLLPDLELPEQEPSVKTFLGDYPSQNEFKQFLNDPESIKEMLGNAIGGGEIKLLKPLVQEGYAAGSNLVKKGINYIHPKQISQETEKFRSSLSPANTSDENIENIAKRIQFANQSGKTEALIPKEKIYSHEGESNLYDIDPEKLGLSEDELYYHRLMPQKRESNYLNNSSIPENFKNGELKNLHDAYENNATLNNYDSLQSAIKKQIREYESRNSIGDVAERKLNDLKIDRDNLDKDHKAFVETLPKELQDLEYTFRKKWAEGPAKYSDKKTELTIKRLVNGDASKLSDSDIVSTFSKPNKMTKKIMQELGTSIGSDVLYSALQKIKPGDAEGMANTILEYYRTTGLKRFIRKDMLDWANAMVKRTSKAAKIRKGLGVAGGATGGALAGSLFGPVGATLGGIAGASTPFAKQYLIKVLGKYANR